MKKITVINLYGKRNIGDMAIRNSALKIIEESLGKNDLVLLCESIDDFPIQVKLKSEINKEFAPYGYAIRSYNKPASLIIKTGRFISILIVSAFYTCMSIIDDGILPRNGFYRYIKILKESDCVIAVGGGYFITGQPVKDFFGITLNLLPIYITKIYKKRILVLPSSFGPFASNIHEFIAGMALKNTVFFARERISLKKVLKYSKKAKYFPDLALYDWECNKKNKFAKYYVLTLREVLIVSKNRQLIIEKEIVQFILDMWKKSNLYCIFIPMASNPIEEDDLIVAKRLDKQINNSKIFRLSHPNSPEEVKDILRNAKFSICNRLHSAILSATTLTPFISIAYAHKTNGFMQSMNLDKWNINMQDINNEILIDKYNELIQERNYDDYIDLLIENHAKINNYRSKLITEIHNNFN